MIMTWRYKLNDLLQPLLNCVQVRYDIDKGFNISLLQNHMKTNKFHETEPLIETLHIETLHVETLHIETLHIVQFVKKFQ